jgi:hypothetical protein
MDTEELNQLLETIRKEANLSEGEKELVRATIMDTTALTVQLISGGNVEVIKEELAIVKATTLNLAYAKKAIVQNHLENFLMKLVQVAVAGVLR